MRNAGNKNRNLLKLVASQPREKCKVLVAKDLQMTYPRGNRAIRNVSFAASNIIGLLGPNGAGKSTLIRMLVGLQRPTSGTVHLDGIEQTKWSLKTRQQIGYLPQEFGVYPEATADEMLDHVAAVKGYTRTRDREHEVGRVLSNTNLVDVRNRRLGEFSVGMRQRFGLAQALIGAPRLLVVDEPTAGLDPNERYQVLRQLSKLANETIVVLSTHIVHDVSALCERAFILNKGSLIDDVDPRVAMETLRGKVWKLFLGVGESEEEAQYQVLSTRLIAGRVVLHCFSHERPRGDAIPLEPTLEDYYMTRLTTSQVGGPNVV